MKNALIMLTLCAGTTAVAGDNIVVTYQRIPNLASSADDMSPDGRFIVGNVDTNQDFFPDGTYIWDRFTDQFSVLPPEGQTARAVSDDGSVVLGQMPDPADPDPTLGIVAARWTQPTGWQSLGYLPNALECPSRSNGYELSADGEVAVGLSWDGCSGRGFVWTQATGMQELQALANGGNRASIVSADGTLVAGFAQGVGSRTPATWDATTLTGETFDPIGATSGEYFGMTEDGSVLLGTAYMGGGDGWFDAIKWSKGSEMEIIADGSIQGGWAGKAMDIADNGTIVGFDSQGLNRRGWIQHKGVGSIVNLKTWAIAHGAVIPSGVQLEVAQAITNDGTVIAGHGVGPSSFEGWILTITETCGDADFAEPFGVLDFTDVVAFLTAFGAGCP